MWGRTQHWTYSCSHCSWKRTTPPCGDVRIKGFNHFTHCPNCQSAPVVCRPASALDSLFEGLPEAWLRAGKR
ncbi:conserved hypothetical protein [Stenotrophomonas geniculata]